MKLERRYRHLLQLLLGAAAAPVFAQGFAIESAVLDTRSSQNLGVTTERGTLADVFKAQKAVTFGILRAAGIPLEQLPPDVRARIERFQTTSIEAFRAFSQGLDLKDQGRFAEAKEFFRRAAEIDPGFGLAVEQQQAMPDVNVSSGVQLRAVIAAASNTAVDRGKQGYVVDLARATAALQAGQSVSVVTLPASTDPAQPSGANDYTSNPPGSGGNFVPNLVAGLAYGYSANGQLLNIASVNEWTGDKYRTSGSVLEAVGGSGDFQAQRNTAGNTAGASVTLGDGSLAYWGTWNSISASNTARVIVAGQDLPLALPGSVDYVTATATTAMPTTGTAVFSPTAAGSLQNVTGNISVNFVTRDVGLNGIGFSIGNLAFSGLTGQATYAGSSATGAFQGNYSAGSCTGCAAFTPGSSAYGGNFVGKDASGLIFSTILLTGSGTASGVQLFAVPH